VVADKELQVVADKESARSGSAARRSIVTFLPRLLVRQGKYRQGSAQRRILRETRIATDRTEAGGVDRLVLGRQLALVDGAMPGGGVFRLKQTGRQTNARPAADAGKHRNILLAAVLI